MRILKDSGYFKKMSEIDPVNRKIVPVATSIYFRDLVAEAGKGEKE